MSVARSLCINPDVLVAPPASLREALRAGRALKNSQLTRGDLSPAATGAAGNNVRNPQFAIRNFCL